MGTITLKQLAVFVSVLVTSPALSFFPVKTDASVLAKPILNEINWAGSQGNPADQWVELYNPSEVVVDFSVSPYELRVNGVMVHALTSGVLPAKGLLLITRLDPASVAAQSSLSSTLNPLVVPGLSIPTTSAQVELREVGSTYRDIANQVVGAPLAGTAGVSGDMRIASQVRQPSETGFYSLGSLQGSWYTSYTYGSGFASGVQQKGTPASSGEVQVTTLRANPELQVPMTPGITQSVENTLPYINATLPMGADQLLVSFTNTTSGVRVPGIAALPLGYQPASPLAPGFYQITVAAADATGSHSEYVVVPNPDHPTDLYLVRPTPATVAAPVLNPVASPTKLLGATISGSVQPGVAVVIYRINDGAEVVIPLAPLATTFNFVVSLELNATTRVSVAAGLIDGSRSENTQVEILQDSLLPAAPALLSVVSNQVGTADTVSGLVGSVESGALVTIFADEAHTQILATVVASADGSFGPVSVGDDRSRTLYVVQTDQAGNMSPHLLLANPLVAVIPSPTPTPPITVPVPSATPVPTVTPVPVATPIPVATPVPAVVVTPVAVVPTSTPVVIPAVVATPTSTPAVQTLAVTTPQQEVTTASPVPSPEPSLLPSSEEGDVQGVATEVSSSWLSTNWWWLLLIVAAALLLWFFVLAKRRKQEDEVASR